MTLIMQLLVNQVNTFLIKNETTQRGKGQRYDRQIMHEMSVRFGDPATFQRRTPPDLELQEARYRV